MIDQIQWLGYGSFFIQGPPFIYINPLRVIRATFHADVILISHHHGEHFSLADVNKMRGQKTRVFSNETVARELDGCEVLRPWQSVVIDRAGIKAVPAYSPSGWQHPLEDGGLGFVISLNYFDIYYAGDTQIIPEMARIHPDIAILPIDGNGTLTVKEAVEVVRQMRPRWVIPSNWNKATQTDARYFKQQIAGRAEVILPSLVD
ncbi:MAG: MBL fold metallo-hydrolase [Anaerolineae bacterium]